MKTILLSLTTIVGMGLLVVGANAFTGSERGDCPGKTVRPLTGEEVCKDRPLRDPNRSDCPGKIECPLTGELVCRDKCPLEASAATIDSNQTPSCCRAAK